MSKDKEFLPALESARGIASLLVMISHFWWWAMEGPAGGCVQRAAPLGVDFFFVLSGFILSKNYLSRDPVPAKPLAYLWNRVARIYPLHLFFLGAFVLAYLATGRPLASYSWFAELTLTTSIHSRHILNGVSWSLSAEWISYLLFTCLILLPTSAARLAPLTGIVLASGLACAALSHGDITSLSYRWGFLRGIFGFFLGCLAWQMRERLMRPRPLIVGALAAQAAYIFLGAGLQSAKMAVVVSMVPVVLHLSRPESQAGFLSWRPVFWVGTVSFSLYMGHVFWGEVLEAFLRRTYMPGPHWLEIAKSAAAFAGAAFTYYLVERPARDMGRRLNPFARR